jgi:hypothetical protein
VQHNTVDRSSQLFPRNIMLSSSWSMSKPNNQKKASSYQSSPCCLLAWFTLKSLKIKAGYVLLKCPWMTTRLHCITSQKTVLSVFRRITPRQQKIYLILLQHYVTLRVYLQFKNRKKNSVAWVREWTMPTKQPPLVGELSANFSRQRVPRGQRGWIPWPYSLLSRPELLFFL